MATMKIALREATSKDRSAISEVVIAAFGEDEGVEIDELVGELLKDETAIPRMSLVAEADGQVAGHILFTKVDIEGALATSAVILAPLAVQPYFQGKGIGGKLIEEGLRRSREAGLELVFVLGYPNYYSRHGFVPAGPLGLAAPYPIPVEHTDAWMVQELVPDFLKKVEGTVRCADALDDPKYWVE